MIYFHRCLGRLASFGVLSLLLIAPIAHAMQDVTAETVDDAIRYGIENAQLGYSAMLGANWIEGPDGLLINIYSPFMMIASKVSKGGYTEANKENIKAARKRYARTIRDYTDPNHPNEVKIALSVYGDTPDFATHYAMWVEGVGRGKTFTLKPAHKYLDKIADHANQQDFKSYEGVNGYYFKVADLLSMENFKLYVQNGSEEPVVFNIVTSKIN